MLRLILSECGSDGSFYGNVDIENEGQREARRTQCIKMVGEMKEKGVKKDEASRPRII